MKYAMVIDLHRCIGCHACAVSCRMANNLPQDVWYCHVNTLGGATMDAAGGTYPNNNLEFYPVNCMHCDNPACVEVCPTGATAKDPETGIVTQDTELCIGCESCVGACPYDSVRTPVREVEFEVDFAMGDRNAPAHLGNTVEKCTFCHHRISTGDIPACTELCVGRARFFGDLDDSNSEVSKLLASRDYHVLKPEGGTSPNVYYLD